MLVALRLVLSGKLTRKNLDNLLPGGVEGENTLPGRGGGIFLPEDVPEELAWRLMREEVPWLTETFVSVAADSCGRELCQSAV